MKLGIISPSAPSTHSEQRMGQFDAGLKTLESLGFQCQLSPHAKDSLSYISASIADRLSDIHQMYKDKSIDAILAANGGWNSSHLLNGIDWKIISANPKPLIGFSDISVLLNAIYEKTGIVQFHGPMVTWGFYENDKITNDSFTSVMKKKEQEFTMDSFGSFLKGRRLSSGLVGGNLVSVRNLLGTPFQPDFYGKIFFWEETEETLYDLDRELTHYKNAGVWSQISGMIIGHLESIDNEFAGKKIDVMDMMPDHFKEYNFPILKTDLFGHNTGKNITLPIGGTVIADKQEGKVSIKP